MVIYSSISRRTLSYLMGIWGLNGICRYSHITIIVSMNNKIALIVLSSLMVCLGVFVVPGAMSRPDYLAVGLIAAIMAHAL